ncbi:hypothetical protein TNCV_3636571 [Trichonephila clavipes]|nr:hypothetical protein TNCV_3636571 [Trichonephila clavipes]
MTGVHLAPGHDEFRGLGSDAVEITGGIRNNRLYGWKFFQTQQQGFEQAEELLSAYVVGLLMPSSDRLQMSLFCGGLGQPFKGPLV